MRTIAFNINSTVTRLYLGVAGEQNATQVVIDCNDYAKEYGEGTAVLLHKRASDSVPYECLSVSQANNIVTWTITVDDTAYNGEGQLELRWTVDNVLKKSKIISTFVKRSLTPQEAEEIKSALELILEAIPTNVDRALAEAKESGDFDGVGITDITFNSDYTLTLTMTDGTEYTTDPIRGEKGEKGDTGNGISNVVLNPDYTLTITFTDGTEYTTTSIRGAKGETGTSITDITFNPNYTLTITMSDGETYTTGSIRGAKGETGTSITNVTLNSNYTLTITMSDGTSYTTGSIRGAKGDKGDTGSKGDKGTSISSVTKTGTSGLVDTYTITYDDNTTSTFTVTNGQNATVSVTSDTDSDYRLTFTDANGSIETPNLYSDVTASAKQLLSDSYTLDQVPYPCRKSPNSDRAVEEIVGGTVAWNQMFVNAAMDDVKKFGAQGGAAINSLTNGVLDVSFSATNGSQIASGYLNLTSGHTFITLVDVKLPSASDVLKLLGGFTENQKNVTGFADWHTYGTVTNGTPYNFWIIRNSSGVAVNNVLIKKIRIIDLTTMFGSTIADYIYSLEQSTAGAGVAKLKEWGFFTEDYYEYSEPTLRSVEGLQSKKTVGFNQWDKSKAVLGWYISDGNGDAVEGANNAHSDYVDVVGGLDYYIKSEQNVGQWGAWYDSEKNFISGITGYNTIKTAPLNARYMRVTVLRNGIGNLDTFCINLSDPTRNGQYEPYESHTYSLDSSIELRGVLKLDSNNNLCYDGDVYPADGNGSRRYGIVDLGTLNWSKQEGSSTQNDRFMAVLSDASKDTLSFPICAKYVTDLDPVYSRVKDKTIIISSGNIYVEDTAYSSSSDFKTAMNGVMLVYPLATPTTFTATPYHNPQIVGDTEEFVTTGLVPVGHNTRYYQNLRKKIEGLPWNFSSLIAPTEVTNKATRNYTAGSYLILNNVLYKVTANIANGGTITPNTNCTATTIMAEFMSL